MNRKAQVWYTDFIIGILIFVFAIITYYNISSNLYDDEKLRIEDLLSNGRYVSSSLISGGIPLDWGNESVIKIGLTDDNYRLNQTKLERFANMSYSKRKGVFGTGFEYFLFFENRSNEIINLSQCGFGNPNVEIKTSGDNCLSVNVSNANPNELVKVERFLIYNSTIIRMVLYLWT